VTSREARLLLEKRPAGGTEDAALRCLALRSRDIAFLRHSQLSNGAWSANHTDQPPNAFLTALALLALRATASDRNDSVGRGIEWLLSLQPAEKHWLWKWKFRLSDRQVRFDPDRYGWPWVPGTVSWIAPTAMTVLALRAWDVEHQRITSADAMLLDRQCPAGGWNAGNSQVFGINLDPHPDFTSMALLALRPSTPWQTVRAALGYLESRLSTCRSPYSLAWGAMALAAYQHPSSSLVRDQLLRCLPEGAPTRVLAAAALALEEPTFSFREFTK